MTSSINPLRPTQSGEAQFRAAQVIELYGDGPIFPGPGWRLSWPMTNEDQRQLQVTASSGSMWEWLSSSFSQLANRPNPWNLSVIHRGSHEGLSLRVVSVLAEQLLQPAQLNIIKPYSTAHLKTAVLVLQSNQHDLAGDAIRLSSLLTLSALLSQRGVNADLPALERALASLIQKVQICCNHQLTSALLDEANRRSIPSFLIDPKQRLYQLGTGIHGRLISSTSNDNDCAFGVSIACRKSKTHDVLAKLGLQVPREIRLPNNIDKRYVVGAANQIGYPCVVKPSDTEQGRGVTANIETELELLEAVQKAKQHSCGQILIQDHIDGDDHRLNVVNGRLEFVVKRSVPSITGDGKATVLELIQRHNAMKRMLRAEDGISTEIDLSSSLVVKMLQKSSASLKSIPAKGVRIRLGKTANITTGGHRQELSIESIHPKIRYRSEIIARTLRLDVCGIDYICANISLDPDCSNGAFIEVNSMPQNAPSRAKMLIDNLFPGSSQFDVRCITIVAKWANDNSRRLQERLENELALHEMPIISFGKHLTACLLPMLTDLGITRVHVHGHPREALLHKTTESLIYLTTPEAVVAQGLPTMLPGKIHFWSDLRSTRTPDLWGKFINRHDAG